MDQFQCSVDQFQCSLSFLVDQLQISCPSLRTNFKFPVLPCGPNANVSFSLVLPCGPNSLVCPALWINCYCFVLSCGSNSTDLSFLVDQIHLFFPSLWIKSNVLSFPVDQIQCSVLPCGPGSGILLIECTRSSGCPSCTSVSRLSSNVLCLPTCITVS